MMWDGKKALSQRIFKEVISILSLYLHNIMWLPCIRAGRLSYLQQVLHNQLVLDSHICRFLAMHIMHLHVSWCSCIPQRKEFHFLYGETIEYGTPFGVLRFSIQRFRYGTEPNRRVPFVLFSSHTSYIVFTVITIMCLYSIPQTFLLPFHFSH